MLGLFYVGCSTDNDEITMNLSTNTLNFSCEGGQLSVTVTSNISKWTINSNATSWLSVSVASGSNNGTVTITADSYSIGGVTFGGRSATITVSSAGVSASEVITVTQY